MTLKKSFGLAFSNLMFDKMRSLLTMLGIIIGVGAVIILISLMDGMMGMMTDQFSKLGTDTITVSVQDRGGSRTIDENDMYTFVDQNPEFLRLSARALWLLLLKLKLDVMIYPPLQQELTRATAV